MPSVGDWVDWVGRLEVDANRSCRDLFDRVYGRRAIDATCVLIGLFGKVISDSEESSDAGMREADGASEDGMRLRCTLAILSVGLRMILTSSKGRAQGCRSMRLASLRRKDAYNSIGGPCADILNLRSTKAEFQNFEACESLFSNLEKEVYAIRPPRFTTGTVCYSVQIPVNAQSLL